MSALARVRGWYDGSGWFVGAAVVLVVFALLALLLGLQSSDRVLWTGQQVVGTEQQGIVTYWWRGQSYSLDEPGFGSARAVSVYLDPADPSNAMLDSVFDRTVAGVLILGPVVAAVVLLVLGDMIRQRIALTRCPTCLALLPGRRRRHLCPEANSRRGLPGLGHV